MKLFDRGSGRLAIALVLSIGGVLGATAAAIWGIPERASRLVASTDLGQGMIATPVVRDLLGALSTQGLIQLDTARVALLVPDDDITLRLKAWGSETKPPEDVSRGLRIWREVLGEGDTEEIQDLVATLHAKGATDIGTVILREFESWNNLHSVAAIRDSITAEDEDPVWSASTQLPGRSDFERPLSTGRSLDHETYGFFGLGDAPSGPWVTVRTGALHPDGKSPTVVFRRELPQEQSAVLDILGRFDSDTGPGVRDASGAALGTVHQLCNDPTDYNPGNGLPIPGCESRGRTTHRVVIDAVDVARQIEVRLSPTAELPAGLRRLLSDLPVSVVPLEWAPCGQGAAGWQGYVDMCSDAGWQVYGDGRPVVLLCRRTAPEEAQVECAIDWIDSPFVPRVSRPATITILAGDGDTLLTLGPEAPGLGNLDAASAAEISRIESLGLMSLFGAGGGDTQGLTGALWAKYASTPENGAAQQPVRETVRLSFDLDLQRALIDELEKTRVSRGGSAIAFTLLDASGRCWRRAQPGCSGRSTRGAIRAAYSGRLTGRPDDGLRSGAKVDFTRGVWNFQAMAAWRERVGYRANPLASFAWTSAGAEFAPGSTFKPVTALAAVEHSVRHGSDRLLNSVLGGSDMDDVLLGSGLPPGVTVARDYVEIPLGRTGERGAGTQRSQRVSNLSRPRLVAATTSGCADTPQARFGLCEAIRTSVNNYFISHALVMEAERPSYATGGQGDPAAVEMARRLVPDYYDLLRPDRELGNRWSRFNGTGFSAMESSADFGRVNDLLFATGQNAFGQMMQTNTAALAAVYAGIATGCRTKPRLEGDGAECEPIFDGSRSEIDEAMSLMHKTLVPGLFAVANAGGSLADFMPGNLVWRDRLYAKTGTGENDDGTNTGWVAGWIEGGPRGDAGRYAFACMVTRTSGFGSQSCGPIVRRVLTKLVELEG